MIVTTSHVSQEVAQVMCYGDGYSLTPAAAVEVPSAIEVYTCPPVMIPDPVTETVDRTINVSDSGDDYTGDGSVGSPFASIKGALADIGYYIRCEITIQLAAGTYNLSLGDLQKLNEIYVENDGAILIIGTANIIQSGLSVTLDGTNKWKQNEAIGGMTINEFQDKFLGESNDFRFPILSNDADSFLIAGHNRVLTTYNSVWEIQTYINIDAGAYYTIESTGDGSIDFDTLHFVLVDRTYIQQSRSGIQLGQNRLIYESTVVNKRNFYGSKAQQYMVTMNNIIFICNVATHPSVRGAVRINQGNGENLVFRNKATVTTGLWAGLHKTEGETKLIECVFQNFPHAMDIDGRGEIELEEPILVKNCGNALRIYGVGGSFFYGEYGSITLDNVDYFFSAFTAQRNIDVVIDTAYITGSPNTAWRVPYTPTTGMWGSISLGTSVVPLSTNYDNLKNIRLQFPGETP